MVSLVRFAHALRAAGVVIGVGQVTRYCEAVTLLDPGDADDLYWAGRSTLICNAADLDIYDAVFAAVFGGSGTPATQRRGADPHRPPTQIAVTDQAEQTHAGSGDDSATVGTTASPLEVLRNKRFSELSPDELAAVRRLAAAVRVHPPERLSRRLARARAGRQPDLRRSLRRALRTHGELLDRSWRRRRTRQRRLVLLLDVSGSMSGYSRALLGFAHAVVRSGGDAEVFCFGTRITRITDAIGGRYADEAVAAAAEQVVDWDGGTRIGDCLGAFIQRWGRAGLARGAVIVICSDGLERGDPERLAGEMARLSRLAHRIVWVNPLKGDPRYQPLARGMAAALPAIDVFLAGHNLTSLEALAEVVTELR